MPEYYKAYDGADYWVVANDMKQCMSLLNDHEFGCDIDEGEDVQIRRISESAAALVQVYLDERDTVKRPLTEAETGSVFSTEF